jgi:hypothetical protein
VTDQNAIVVPATGGTVTFTITGNADEAVLTASDASTQTVAVVQAGNQAPVAIPAGILNGRIGVQLRQSANGTLSGSKSVNKRGPPTNAPGVGIAPSGGFAIAGAEGLAFHDPNGTPSDGDEVLFITTNANVYRVRATDGTLLGSTPFSNGSMAAVDSAGQCFFAQGPATRAFGSLDILGNATGPFPTGFDSYDVALTPNGRLWIAFDNTRVIREYVRATGAATGTTLDLGFNPAAIEYLTDANAFVAATFTGQLHWFALDYSPPVTRRIGTYTGSTNVSDLFLVPSRNQLLVSNRVLNGTLDSIDLANGTIQWSKQPVINGNPPRSGVIGNQTLFLTTGPGDGPDRFPIP